MKVFRILVDSCKPYRWTLHGGNAIDLGHKITIYLLVNSQQSLSCLIYSVHLHIGNVSSRHSRAAQWWVVVSILDQWFISQRSLFMSTEGLNTTLRWVIFSLISISSHYKAEKASRTQSKKKVWCQVPKIPPLQLLNSILRQSTLLIDILGN